MTPKDRIAFTIAAGLVGWGIVALGIIGWRNKGFADAGGEIFVAIAGGLVAALGAYFATRNGNNK